MRHDGEVNLLDLHNRGIENRVQQLWKQKVRRTVWTMGTATAPHGEMNLLDLHNRDIGLRVQQLWK